MVNTVGRCAGRLLVLLAVVVVVLRGGVLAKDMWHRPGSHKVGHTRTIHIPDCVEFTISTNACRGFCESFAGPTAPVIDGEAAAAGQPNNLNNNHGNEGTAAGFSASANHAQHHPHAPHLMAVHGNAIGGGGGGGGGRRPPANKPVTSVGQCSNIMESEDVQVRVNCLDGPRNLTFKSATKCACYHCKKD